MNWLSSSSVRILMLATKYMNGYVLPLRQSANKRFWKPVLAEIPSGHGLLVQFLRSVESLSLVC